MTERLHFHFSLSCIEKEMATHSSVLAWRIPGTGVLVGCRLGGCTESDTTEATQQQHIDSNCNQNSYNFYSIPCSLTIAFIRVGRMTVLFITPPRYLKQMLIHKQQNNPRMHSDAVFTVLKIYLQTERQSQITVTKSQVKILLASRCEFNNPE